MKRALTFLVAALAFVLVPVGSSVNSWSDPAGDSGTAPDITYVTVSDTAAGIVSFRVMAHFVPNTGVSITVDAVKNGAEIEKPRVVWMSVGADGSLSSGVVWWHGPAIPEIAVAATVSADAATVSFPALALEIEDVFVFRLFSVNLMNGNADNVPNFSGMLFYQMTPPAPPPPPAAAKPLIGKPVATPALPVAGKRFRVSFPITRSDDGTPLTTASVNCRATVAGKIVPHRHTFTNGTVKATLTVPKAAKGKQLKIAVKVAAEGKAATKVFTFKVR